MPCCNPGLLESCCVRPTPVAACAPAGAYLPCSYLDYPAYRPTRVPSTPEDPHSAEATEAYSCFIEFTVHSSVFCIQSDGIGSIGKWIR